MGTPNGVVEVLVYTRVTLDVVIRLPWTTESINQLKAKAKENALLKVAPIAQQEDVVESAATAEAGSVLSPSQPGFEIARGGSALRRRAAAKALAQRTRDAYSFDRYGYSSWHACCAMLLRRGFSEEQAEKLMRSRWTRAAADFNAKVHDATSGDLARYLENTPWYSVSEDAD